MCDSCVYIYVMKDEADPVPMMLDVLFDTLASGSRAVCCTVQLTAPKRSVRARCAVHATVCISLVCPSHIAVKLHDNSSYD